MEPLKLVVVSAGLGQPSATRMLADRLAEATARGLREQGRAVDLRVLELRESAVDIANNLVTGFPNTALADVVRAAESADGLIAVSPIFSASYSGLFKSFFDVLGHQALTGKPVLIGATGGTARHSLALDHALRPLFSYLRALVVPTGVYAATEDWGASSSGAGAADLAGRIERAAAELAALLAARPEIAASSDAYFTADEALVPFEQLLAG
jgi:FMN reductase